MYIQQRLNWRVEGREQTNVTVKKISKTEILAGIFPPSMNANINTVLSKLKLKRMVALNVSELRSMVWIC